MVSKFVQQYRSNPSFYLYFRWRDMRNRTLGKKDGGGKKCRWFGLPIDPRPDFIAWALNNPSFKKCWKEWHDNDFSRRGPTVHRIDRQGGYTLDNMVFVTHAEKSRKHLADGKKTKAKKKG